MNRTWELPGKPGVTIELLSDAKFFKSDEVGNRRIGVMAEFKAYKDGKEFLHDKFKLVTLDVPEDVTSEEIEHLRTYLLFEMFKKIEEVTEEALNKTKH